MKIIKLLGLTAAMLYLPINDHAGDPFYISSDAIAQDISWGVFKKEKEGDTKIDGKIRDILVKINASGMTRSNVQDFSPEEFSTVLVKVNEQGEVQVYVYVTDVNEENISKLKENDLQVEIVNEKYKVVQGWLPFDRVDEVSKLDFVTKITAPSYGTPRTGSVNTEGDSVLHSDDVREMLGIDGSGVDVCVISDGVDNRASAQASGDLPNNISINPLLPGSGDEGTAMLEIIHDIAPGANLFFSGGFGGITTLEMLESIMFCASSSDIIVDDIGFLLEPYFEDGPVAQEARNAVQQGVVYVSAAGNAAMRHYQALYVDTNPADVDNNIHDFGLAAGEESDIGMLISTPGNLAIILQWNDKFGQSSNDYNLFLFDAITLDLLATSNEVQDGDDDPIEGIVISDLGISVPFFIVINRFSGESKSLEIFFNGLVEVLTFNVPSDSIFGHPAVSEVIAVGAVPFSDPFSVEDFSSEGPSTIFFPGFEQRPKPDVVAPNGVATTVPGFMPFSGTSAAAPHVAGVAALVLQANPALTPSEVKDALTNTAIDLESASLATVSSRNNMSGFGLVDALAAVQSVAPTPTPTPTPTITASPTPSPTPSPTSPPPGGDGDSGSSGCTVAGQVQLGTAMVNMLIPLIPAFAVGLRMIRRRKKNFI